MGIKNFSKVFDAVREVKIKDLAGMCLAIDAMTEIYRSALGAKTVKQLTDKYGEPTMHISVIFANIIEMQKYGIKPIWVFDHDQDSDTNADFHNPAKLGELIKRKKRKEEAKQKLDNLKKLDDLGDAPLFSDSEDENDIVSTMNILDQDIVDTQKIVDDNPDTDLNEMYMDAIAIDNVDKSVIEKERRVQEIKNKTAKLEKQLFTASKNMINDIKLILNCLNIKYVEAPAGYEGEQIAALMSAGNIVDGVYSGDTDPIPFGAAVLYRKNARDKKIYEYELVDILQQMSDGGIFQSEPTLADLRKVCVALGSDFAPKTPGIGPKTILKKINTIVLTDTQEIDGIGTFEKSFDISNLVIKNQDKIEFKDCSLNDFITWVTEERSFSATRINNALLKVLDMTGEVPIPKPFIKIKEKVVRVARQSKEKAVKVKKIPLKKGVRSTKLIHKRGISKSPKHVKKIPLKKGEKRV
jgi:hypothetical protein